MCRILPMLDKASFYPLPHWHYSDFMAAILSMGQRLYKERQLFQVRGYRKYRKTWLAIRSGAVWATISHPLKGHLNYNKSRVDLSCFQVHVRFPADYCYLKTVFYKRFDFELDPLLVWLWVFGVIISEYKNRLFSVCHSPFCFILRLLCMNIVDCLLKYWMNLQKSYISENLLILVWLKIKLQ